MDRKILYSLSLLLIGLLTFSSSVWCGGSAIYYLRRQTFNLNGRKIADGENAPNRLTSGSWIEHG